jgi:LacI family transcriptional regulator
VNAQGKPPRRTKGVATIQHVARAAGVSPMTVSRVINGSDNVRETTRARVVEAARRLNFAPNNAARSLASGQALHVGLLYSNPSAAYLSHFLVGSLSAARRLGLHLVLESCDSADPSEQAEIVRALEAGHVAGVVVPPPLSESLPVLTELDIIGLPVVTVAGARPHRLDVAIDDQAAAAEMTRHLIGLGHRVIGFIAGHPNQHASHDRARGFRQTCAEAGIATADAPVEQGYFTYRSGLAAAERLLSASPRPTAIFASNDDMAAATVSIAQRRGLRVPEDLSVTGFDDTSLATTLWPALTTVRQPIADMAEAALETLSTQFRGGRARTIVLPHELVLRQSSAPPPAGGIARRPAKRVLESL